MPLAPTPRGNIREPPTTARAILARNFQSFRRLEQSTCIVLTAAVYRSGLKISCQDRAERQQSSPFRSIGKKSRAATQDPQLNPRKQYCLPRRLAVDEVVPRMHPARFASSKSGEPVFFNIFLSEGECLFWSAFGKASTFEVGGCWMCCLE